MLHRLTRPLSPHAVVVMFAAIVAFMTAYCLAYNALQGSTETLANAAGWPIVNILPFALAIEIGKRFTIWVNRFAILYAMLILSLSLDFIFSSDFELAFELVRRIPALIIVPLALAIVDWVATGHAPRRAHCIGELPLLAEQIDYVRAAGNYVELHGLGRVILHRSTMAAICDHLSSSDFVRVHRSVLVRAAAVKRWWPDYIEMHDGSVHRIGARYRASIAENMR